MNVDAHNLQAIFAMRALWEKLDPAAPPSLATLKPPGARRNVALLPGSFNPPTAAHMLLAERALDDLPDASNVIYMVGRKFGTSAAKAQTWATNSYLPGLVAQRYRQRTPAMAAGRTHRRWTAREVLACPLPPVPA